MNPTGLIVHQTHVVRHLLRWGVCGWVRDSFRGAIAPRIQAAGTVNPNRDRKGAALVANPCFPPLPYGRGSERDTTNALRGIGHGPYAGTSLFGGRVCMARSRAYMRDTDCLIEHAHANSRGHATQLRIK